MSLTGGYSMRINRNRISTALVACAVGAVAFSILTAPAHAQVIQLDGPVPGNQQIAELEQQAAALRANGGPVDQSDRSTPVDVQQLEQQLLVIHEDLQQLIALQTRHGQGRWP
jgi:hypothetical protein